MSLIEEALRRVQDIRPPSPPARKPVPPPRAPAPPPPPAVTEHQRAPTDREGPLVIHPAVHRFAAKWIGLVCVLGIAVGVSLGTYRYMQTLRPVTVELPAPPPPPIVMASAPEPLPKTLPEAPPFTLSGVVEGVGEPFAIINQQIVRLGEEIDGAVLIAVGNNRARLRRRDSNEEVTLHTIR